MGKTSMNSVRVRAFCMPLSSTAVNLSQMRIHGKAYSSVRSAKASS